MNTYKDPEFRGYYLGKVVAALIVLLIIVIAVAAARERGVIPTPAAASATPAAVAAAPTAATSASATSAATAATPAVQSAELSPDGVLTLSGVGKPGSNVELYAGGTKLGIVVVGADGAWTYQGAIAPGQYRFVARTVDATGRVVNESAVMAVSFGPGAASPAGATSGPGEIATAAPGAATTAASGTAGAGARAAATPVPLILETAAPPEAQSPAPGKLATGAPPTAEVSAPGAAATPVPLILETAAPPAAQSPAPGRLATSAPPTAEVSAPGAAGGPKVPQGLALTRATVGEGGQVTLIGTGQPGVTVEIIRGGKVTGAAVVKNDGTWSFAYLATPGVQTVAIQYKGQPGTRSAPVSFQIEGTPSAAATPKSKPKASATAVKPQKTGTGRAYIVREGDYLTKLAARFYGDGAQWQTIYKGTNKMAEKDHSFAEIEDPDLIIPGWKLWIPEK